MLFRLFPLLVFAFATLAGRAQVGEANIADVAMPEPTEKRAYKEVAGTKLEIWIWQPANWRPDDRRSVIVFFHGGSWLGGSPDAFARQARQLAQRGMVAFSVRYRLKSQPGVTVYDCVKDAKSAFRWIVTHAPELGINPQRIAAGGSSSGGHLAAALATLDAINEPTDDANISTVPAALVLFAPVLQLEVRRIADAAGARSPQEIAALSPFAHLTRGHPPTIIFHGEADLTVPIRTVRDYAAKVKEHAGQCTVVGFADQPHGFYHREPFLSETLKTAEAFLREQHVLE
jgi:acetyl esterase